ncbi:acyl-CoA dehydrogenase family protein [Streptacidiphilus sp. ASG 303]|uniref:acyl-CoA dehydrogenase family protein n=1 Tax=Streptacidiphilus sp. ASG 303 TaxID=2896847 RepID=UPI001E4BBD6A|nr:acyl-CoA dehydrogenase family protein [Streptacidiphilus sp. ASG 303]MCD0483991.1 acyl-CoA dehydrogenase family protein [Streptacidiphilus sp. ASG 303]
MRRTVFSEDHEAFRATVREFIAKEVVPVYPEWEKAGHAPRDFYRRLGELGVFGIEVPEEYGGAGMGGFKYQAVVTEETMRAGVSLGSAGVHTGLVLPYILEYGSEDQKKRWLPGFVSGEIMTAIAMTEPGTGSDLAGITTRAELSADGTHYVLNGAKTFITGGVQADLMLVVCRTSPAGPEDRRGGLSILCVDTRSPGYAVGRKLEKIGLRTSDTAELSFTDVRVPVENLLGEEGRAFSYLTRNLVQERLAIAVGGYASAQAAVGFAVQYVKDRQVFGRTVAEFQNTKFVLAECAAEVEAAQSMVDRALELHETGELTPADAAKLKLFCTEVSARVVDKCLQLHGGYGYILEYPIARLYTDARVTRIYGGTSEVMKTVIAKSLGL